MLDTLQIRIPLHEGFYTQTGSLYSIVGDLSYYPINSAPTYMSKDIETGEISHGISKHPFESIPSSFSGMAIKFYSDNVANTPPYIMLSASPKILQGHNVYGGESVKNLSFEMLALLKDYYPEFFGCLDVRNTTISRIDSTFSVRVEHERLIQPCLRFFANLSNGQRRNDTDKRDFYNTVYYGGRTSRYGNAVIYGKSEDVKREVNELQRKVKRGCSQSSKKLEVFTPELLDFAQRLLRFESRTKTRKLEQIGLPTNLFDFIKFQDKNKNVLRDLWRLWFDPILQALKGDITMESYDDAKIYDLCVEKLSTRTRAGKLSLTKANNAFNFYQLLKSSGWEDVKKRYSNNAFYTAVRSLTSLGLPKAFLQNLANEKLKSVPMIEIMNFDFANQCPADYQPPISNNIHRFDSYLKPQLTLVA